MVVCNHHCPGIALDLNEGIVPRCLLLETEGHSDAQGTAIVGINPGPSGARERNFYLTNGPTYEQVVNYWRTHVSHRHKYYTGLRKLSTELGFSGPILWTELVKCESAPDQKKPPLQTFRTCTRTYLQEELEAVPDDWPLIAVGREAYKALAYLFANRAVIGVPHPTGSFGHFHRLFDTGRLLPEVKAQTKGLWDGEMGKAVWLTAETHTRQSPAG